MDQLLTMSNREITRLEVMQRLKEKRLKQKEAAQMLAMLRRTETVRPGSQKTLLDVSCKDHP